MYYVLFKRLISSQKDPNAMLKKERKIHEHVKLAQDTNTRMCSKILVLYSITFNNNKLKTALQKLLVVLYINSIS